MNISLIKTFKKGMTLVEILIVIALMGIIGAIGFAGFGGISSGSQFASNKAALTDYLKDARYRSYSEGKPIKVILEVSGDDYTLKTYEPTGTRWRDINLNRRCDCAIGDVSGTDCDNAFSNVALASMTSDTDLDKTVEQTLITTCDDANCTNELANIVEMCFLPDGTSPSAQWFKIYDDDLSQIFRLNNTGYVE